MNNLPQTPESTQSHSPRGVIERLKHFYEQHEPACTAALFIAGFLFDTLAVGRIDKLHNIIHQASYLFLCALFMSLEMAEHYGAFTPPARLQTAWRYQAGATHFMLGTLLNIYTLFFFKSASMGLSLIFLIILAALLAINELKPFERSGTLMRMTLFSLCLISYFSYLVPTLMGYIGVLPFLGAIFVASLCVAFLVWRLSVKLPNRMPDIIRQIVTPFVATAVLFFTLYFAKAIPPVPLALYEIGIYHDVTREGKHFSLSSTRARWKFWQKGDQTFLARPGDAVFCWVSVFSPTHFKERLNLRWQIQNAKGNWTTQDNIALDIVGGRDDGWRGFTSKTNYKPGLWQIAVLTSDNRELGSINFEVIPDLSNNERTIHIEPR